MDMQTFFVLLLIFIHVHEIIRNTRSSLFDMVDKSASFHIENQGSTDSLPVHYRRHLQ